MDHVGYKTATGVSKPQTMLKPMIIRETDCKAKWLRSEYIGFNKLLYQVDSSLQLLSRQQVQQQKLDI